MFSFAYNFVLHLLGLLFLPKFLFCLIFRGKYRSSFANRFGFGFLVIEGRGVIWVHAVSVGEVRAVSGLVKRLRLDYSEAVIILSCITETGYAEGLRSIPEADYHVYLPLDLSYIVRPIVRRVAPDVVILCETDFWWNFLSEARDVGADLVLVNGKMSQRSLNRYSKFPIVAERFFSMFRYFCVQNGVYEERFKKVGIPKNKLFVTGNLKFDDEYVELKNEELFRWRKDLGLSSDDKVVVIGSTHDPEEIQLLNIMKDVWTEFPSLRVLLLPRHPERFDYVRSIIKDDRVILIDKMGCLREVYQLADIAIVGGSFITTVGGHNILEPVKYNVPVLFGPYMYSQPGMEELVLEYGAGVKMELSRVGENVLNLLKNEKLREAMGEAGKHLFEDVQGSVEKTFSIVEKVIEENKGLC